MKILFVCTGNICRSPTADAILRQRVAAMDLPWSVDSAGTHGYHVGDPPDRRAIDYAALRGVDMTALRARRINERDYAAFDLILAMDRSHFEILQRQSPLEQRHKIRLFLEESGLSGSAGDDVPDPYYGALEGFQAVFDLLEKGIDALIPRLSARPHQKNDQT